MNDPITTATLTTTTTTPADTPAVETPPDTPATLPETTPEPKPEEARSPRKRRFDGPTVFGRVQREVLKLRRLIEGYREQREPELEDEDPTTKNVFDALEDLSKVSAELQGIVEVLEHVVHPDRPDVLAELREEKRKKAARRRGDRNPEIHRFKVSPTARAARDS